MSGAEPLGGQLLGGLQSGVVLCLLGAGPPLSGSQHHGLQTEETRH